MSKIKVKPYDDVISSILLELDSEHALYQKLHGKFHGTEDSTAKYIHSLLIELCKRIRREISLRERE
jgi:hypothetical protein